MSEGAASSPDTASRLLQQHHSDHGTEQQQQLPEAESQQYKSILHSPEPQRIWQPSFAASAPSSHPSSASEHRLSYPPRAHVSNHGHHHHHAQHKSVDGHIRDGHSTRQHSSHESRRETQGTIHEYDKHDTRSQHHRSSQPRSHERLYLPDDGRVVIVDEDDEDEDELNAHSLLRAMLLLSAPVALLSLAICLLAAPTIILTIISSPLRLCFCTMDPFATRLQRYLLPLLNLHRRCMSLLPVRLQPRARLSDSSPMDNLSTVPEHLLPCRTRPLIYVLVLSPLFAGILMFAAWVTSFAWMCSSTLNHESIADVSKGERRMARRLLNTWLSWLDWPLEDGLGQDEWGLDEEVAPPKQMPEVLEIKAPASVRS